MDNQEFVEMAITDIGEIKHRVEMYPELIRVLKEAVRLLVDIETNYDDNIPTVIQMISHILYESDL